MNGFTAKCFLFHLLIPIAKVHPIKRVRGRFMKNSLKPENIIEEIQFELAQGLIRKEELGEAIRSVRNFSNKIRKEILENYPLDGKLREIFQKSLF